MLMRWCKSPLFTLKFIIINIPSRIWINPLARSHKHIRRIGFRSIIMWNLFMHYAGGIIVISSTWISLDVCIYVYGCERYVIYKHTHTFHIKSLSQSGIWIYFFLTLSLSSVTAASLSYFLKSKKMGLCEIWCVCVCVYICFWGIANVSCIIWCQ